MTVLPMLDPVLGLALRSSVALVLLSAAVHKLRDPAAFAAVVADYRLVPRASALVLSRLIILAELMVGATLPIARGAAVGAFALFAMYSAAIAINLRRGRRDLDCGCAGPARRVPIGPSLLVRNAVLIAGSLAALLPSAARDLVWLDGVTLIASIAALALLYGAAEIVMSHPLDSPLASMEVGR